MALTNAERQARYRERRKAGESRTRYRRPADRRSQPQQWNDAVHTLLALQDQYREWRDALPESLAGSATAALLEQVCDLDRVRLLFVGGPTSLCGGGEAGGSWIRQRVVVVRKRRRGPVSDGTCAVSDRWGFSAGTRALRGRSQYASKRRLPVAP